LEINRIRRRPTMFTLSWSRGHLARVLTVGVALSFAWGAVVVTALVSAAPASAHAALVKITPNADATLTTAPTEVVLQFDEPVSPTFATVVVTTAAGVNVARGKPTVLGARVTQPLSPAIASGGYRIAYRVVSNDGHPVSGESHFSLTLASGSGSATPVGTPPTSGSATSATAAASTIAGPSSTRPQPGPVRWPSRYLVPGSGAVAFLAIGAGLFVWYRQRR
jgi:copper resistance protein C